MRGRRDEIDMIAMRMFGATYRGRMKEAGELATDLQARAIALSRGASAGNAVVQLAISEALVGLADQAKARLAKAEDDGILDENALDERLVVAAILRDASAARELLPQALAEQRKNAGTRSRRNVRGRAGRCRRWPLLAESKPAEASS